MGCHTRTPPGTRRPRRYRPRPDSGAWCRRRRRCTGPPPTNRHSTPSVPPRPPSRPLSGRATPPENPHRPSRRRAAAGCRPRHRRKSYCLSTSRLRRPVGHRCHSRRCGCPPRPPGIGRRSGNRPRPGNCACRPCRSHQTARPAAGPSRRSAGRQCRSRFATPPGTRWPARCRRRQDQGRRRGGRRGGCRRQWRYFEPSLRSPACLPRQEGKAGAEGWPGR